MIIFLVKDLEPSIIGPRSLAPGSDDDMEHELRLVPKRWPITAPALGDLNKNCCGRSACVWSKRGDSRVAMTAKVCPGTRMRSKGGWDWIIYVAIGRGPCHGTAHSTSRHENQHASWFQITNYPAPDSQPCPVRDCTNGFKAHNWFPIICQRLVLSEVVVPPFPVRTFRVSTLWMRPVYELL